MSTLFIKLFEEHFNQPCKLIAGNNRSLLTVGNIKRKSRDTSELFDVLFGHDGLVCYRYVSATGSRSYVFVFKGTTQSAEVFYELTPGAPLTIGVNSVMSEQQLVEHYSKKGEIKLIPSFTG